MNQPLPKQSIKDDVLKAIESGQVKMRPKWQFILSAGLFACGTVLIALTALFFVSFIVFMLRETGVWFIPGFGFSNLGIFLTSLPPILIAVSLIFLILLEILIKKYSFAYDRPFIYSALGVIIVVLIGGLTIGYTTFHQSLFEQAERGHLPFGGSLYHHFMQPMDNITVGTITEITTSGFTIEDPRDRMFFIVISPQTRFPIGTNFKIGDNVVILGARQGNIIRAMGIQKPNFLPPPTHFKCNENACK